MQHSTSKHLFGIVMVGVLLVLGMATDVMAQGRGRRSRQFDKKCEKFVNCHDARDGRWDGRGPDRDRRDRFGNIFGRNRRTRFDRRDRFDRSDRFERRRRHRDRDWNDDRRWRGRR